MKTWLIYHAQALQLVLSRFKTNKFSTLLICLSIGVTLALPATVYIILDNLNALVSDVKNESQISVFLSADIKQATVLDIKNTLEKNTAIQRVKFVSKQDALAQLMANKSNQIALDSLINNPLPDAFFIQPEQLDAASVALLQLDLSKIQGVDEVLVDGAWIKRLNYLLLLGKKILIILAGLLGFALIAVIGNTIRMQILTQQAEIELSQLIGATPSFIRRPFLYLGALYGLGGGVLAVLISWLIIGFLNQTIKEIAANYQLDFSLHYLSDLALFALLTGAIALGWLAAYCTLTLYNKKS